MIFVCSFFLGSYSYVIIFVAYTSCKDMMMSWFL